MIKVEWDHKACIHSANCVKKLPNGIQVENRQFVIDETGHRKTVKSVAAECPSGALNSRRKLRRPVSSL